MLVCQGLVHGAQPVLGYNYGAGAEGRVKQGVRFVTISSIIYTFLCWVLAMLIPRTLTSIFNNEPEMIAICAPAIRIYFCGFVFMSLQMSGQCTFVGLGKSKRAVFFSMFRKVVIVVPLILLLPRLPIFGVNGVFWAEPISDFIGGAACFITMYFTVYRKLGDSMTRRTE